MNENRRMKQNRRTERRNADRRRDLLRPALADLSTSELKQVLEVRDARIEIRCASTIKDEIEATAGQFGLTVTTYLLRLHELAKSKLNKVN